MRTVVLFVAAWSLPVLAAVAADVGVEGFRKPARAAHTRFAVEPRADMRFTVESGPVVFGGVAAGDDADLRDAIVVRVFSDRDWRLKLMPAGPPQVPERGESVPLSRLEWRPSGTAAYRRFHASEAVTVGRGPRTAGSGARVAVDLRLRLGDDDPLGVFGASFRLEIEPL